MQSDGVTVASPVPGGSIVREATNERGRPRRRPGLLHVCTGGDRHKAQEQNGLVSGPKDRRYPSVTRECTTKTCRQGPHPRGC